MLVTRRRFFEMLIAAIGAGGAIYAAGRGPARGWYHRLALPALGHEPPGSVTAQAMRVLRAATETLIDYPVDIDHYTDFFRWRAENLPGYRSLYERFAATVNQTATETRRCEFATCDAPARTKILAMAFQVRARQGRLDRMRMNSREREWVLFDLHIVRPITLLFARTDAWRQAGYDAWPGTPRGLERYVQAPSAADTLRPRSGLVPREIG